jgi:hypothetical protein
MVYIKRVKTGDLESSLALMLSSPGMRLDSRNHSVPILDHILDANDAMVSYIVMPFLQEFFFPAFELVKEIVDFVDQILEVRQLCSLYTLSIFDVRQQGLVFMHEQGVAHRYRFFCLVACSIIVLTQPQGLQQDEHNDGCLCHVSPRMPPDGNL